MRINANGDPGTMGDKDKERGGYAIFGTRMSRSNEKAGLRRRFCRPKPYAKRVEKMWLDGADR
jgi:hypothetical protein